MDYTSIYASSAPGTGRAAVLAQLHHLHGRLPGEEERGGAGGAAQLQHRALATQEYIVQLAATCQHTAAIHE